MANPPNFQFVFKLPSPSPKSDSCLASNYSTLLFLPKTLFGLFLFRQASSACHKIFIVVKVLSILRPTPLPEHLCFHLASRHAPYKPDKSPAAGFLHQTSHGFLYCLKSSN